MDSKIVYEINGRRVTFVDVRMEHGYIRGYNSKRKKWASIFDGCLQFDGEELLAAKKVE